MLKFAEWSNYLLLLKFLTLCCIHLTLRDNTYCYLLLYFFQHLCGSAIRGGTAYNWWTKNFCKIGHWHSAVWRLSNPVWRTEKRNEISSFSFMAKSEKSLHLIKHKPQECLLNGSSSIHVSVVSPPWAEPQIPTGWASELFGRYEENYLLSMLGIKPQCLWSTSVPTFTCLAQTVHYLLPSGWKQTKFLTWQPYQHFYPKILI